MERTKLEKELELYCKEAVSTYRGDFTDLVFDSFENGEDVDEDNKGTYFILYGQIFF